MPVPKPNENIGQHKKINDGYVIGTVRSSEYVMSDFYATIRNVILDRKQA